MPEPGPYGPLPWSHPRPSSLWAFVILYAMTAVYWTVFISEGRAISVAWIAGSAVVYLLWRGSRLAWVACTVLLPLFVVVSVVEIGMATAPGGHHPIVHVFEALLLTAMLVLLTVPATRCFYNLQSRTRPDDSLG